MPTLTLGRSTVREVRSVDAPALAAALDEPSIRQFIAAPSLAAADLARFIRWARKERRHERLACFAIVPHDGGTAAGIFQLWPVAGASGVMEIGFAIARRFWGTGLFRECAHALIDFAVTDLRVHRVEARVAADNRRAAASLSALGAVREGTLRQCFRSAERYADYELWSILADGRPGTGGPAPRQDAR